MKRIVAALTVVSMLVGFGASKPVTEGRQVSARNACQGLVSNRLGRVTFRDAEETWSTAGSGTTYVATGRADTVLASYHYRCTSTIYASDMTLRTKLDKLEM